MTFIEVQLGGSDGFVVVGFHHRRKHHANPFLRIAAIRQGVNQFVCGIYTRLIQNTEDIGTNQPRVLGEVFHDCRVCAFAALEWTGGVVCPLIAVDCNLRLGESEGTQRFDNLPRQQHAAGHHPEVETDPLLPAEPLQFRCG